MEIILSPDPLLRQVCEPCDLNDKSLKRLAKKMAQAMYKNNGVGLAAPQVGVLKRLIVVDCDPEHEVSETQSPIYLLNPVIVDLEGEGVSEDEGCL